MSDANSFDRALAFHRNALQLFAAAACAMTTANKITVVRIVMIPAFVTMAIYYGESIQRGQPLEWQRFAAIAIFRPIRRLNSADLPTFGRPTIATLGSVWVSITKASHT